ncbi:uncharacterized protein G2W53_017847 [Senna tora]|uniref:Uncharacterized protein n=1 Tax=Senna tora TaxID=362788 RepID=A0A834WMV0_9FABA|nr:uncharacterized protein G2W53_017847 [Senna tora]
MDKKGPEPNLVADPTGGLQEGREQRVHRPPYWAQDYT